MAGPLDWPIRTLRMAGMWSRKGPLFIMPATAWLFVCLLVFIIGNSNANMVQRPSLPSIIEAVSFTLLSSVCVLKVYVVGSQTRQIAEMQDYLQKIKRYEGLVSLEADELNLQSMRISRKFCMIFTTTMGQVLLMTVGTVFFQWFVNKTRQLPFLVPDIFLDNETLYWLFVVVLLATQYLYIVGSGSFDTLYMTLCLQLRAKGRILEAMFTRVRAKKEKRYSVLPDQELAVWDAPDSDRAVTDADLVFELERCVVYHQHVIRLHGKVEDFFATSLLYILVYFVVALGAPLLRVMWDKDARIGDGMLQISLAMGNLMQLSFICWFGDMVAESLDRVRDAAFFTYRQGMSWEARNSLLMVIVRTGKPLYLTANKAAYLTVHLLMAVLRRSHSIYSAAYNLR